VVFYTATRDQNLRARAAALGPVVDKSEPLQALLKVMLEWNAPRETVARAVGEVDPNPSPSGRSGLRVRMR
jgi:hypothetical protein